jgi:hypothetical protein
MPYELFNRKRTHGGPPGVTITKYGNFVVNSAAIEHFGKNRFVQVYWDRDQGMVGLKPIPKKEEHAYHLNLSPKGNVGSLSATAFLKHVGYPIKDTKSFSAVWSEKQGMLEFKILEKGGTPKGTPRLSQ